MKHLLPFICFLFLCCHSEAQNIVEIFGREKIQTTDEGTVFHQFTDGLALRGSVNPGYAFNAQDIIGWQYAAGKFHTPKSGEVMTEVYPIPQRGTDDDRENENSLKNWIWTEVKANDKGQFNRLRSAYLYTACRMSQGQKALLETTGGTRSYVNGILYEGDHYDYGWQLTPITLKDALNEFVYTPGRFGRIAAKLVKPRQDIMLTKRDRTEAELLIGNTEPVWSSVRVINMTDDTLRGYCIKATLESGETLTYKTDNVPGMSLRKVRYQLPPLAASQEKPPEKTKTKIELLDTAGKVIDALEFETKIVSPLSHHTRTFISRIDGSVQFFSIKPALRTKPEETKGLVLSTHGASVDARVQAGCYSQKDWIDLVAATGRRPFGFNWEDWGRIDALEVLEAAKQIYKPEPSKIYVTGHSMGGHGAWYLGTTYPDMFAATGPCAGYPDRMAYVRDSADGNAGNAGNPKQEAAELNAMFDRSANAARLLKRIENIRQIGVYVFHGSEDTVVPTRIAQKMRSVLGQFHPDFVYEEFKGGTHWFGTQCMDWLPIFEYFKRHTIPQTKDVKDIDFTTASPSVSHQCFWASVQQQVKPFEMSRIQAGRKDDTVTIKNVENTALLALDIPALEAKGETLNVIFQGAAQNKTFTVKRDKKAVFAFDGKDWQTAEMPDAKQKNPQRFGNFKEAINNNVVFVYATGGTDTENELYRRKAVFDADTFYYRGNGSIDVIPDTEYCVEKYKDRNVMVYGTKDCSKVWNILLSKSPIQVLRNKAVFDGKELTGEDIGAYFVYPHPQSDTALVGVVAATGEQGIRAAYANNYISPVTGFPDFIIFRSDWLRTGLQGVEVAGYFDNNWSLDNNDYQYR